MKQIMRYINSFLFSFIAMGGASVIRAAEIKQDEKDVLLYGVYIAGGALAYLGVSKLMERSRKKKEEKREEK